MDEAKKLVEKLGFKVEEWTDEMLANLAARKAAMDKETRRDLRIYWLVACLICILLGYGIHALGIA